MLSPPMGTTTAWWPSVMRRVQSPKGELSSEELSLKHGLVITWPGRRRGLIHVEHRSTTATSPLPRILSSQMLSVVYGLITILPMRKFKYSKVKWLPQSQRMESVGAPWGLLHLRTQHLQDSHCLNFVFSKVGACWFMILFFWWWETMIWNLYPC